MAEPQSTETHAAQDATQPERDDSLGYTLQDLVLESPDVEEFLTDFAALAASELSTASNAVTCGVTVVRRKKGVVAASSDEKGRALDELQNSFGDGPCLTALRDKAIVHVPDTSAEPRWPAYMKAVARHGIGSILAVALDLAGEADAVLNLYSASPHGFSGPDITATKAFAEHAAKALRLALRLAHLRHTRDDLAAAMKSRATIDTAVGIIMAQNRCGRDAAFGVLTQASNHRNVKLRDVAAGVIASVSGESELPAHFDE
ncbi:MULTISPECIES: GAF and ANTAR domain-containing protein [unclassified Arthrobacter]|uniref:GAF and ANTAR domain-containing protein n=1 Tax=unclassified Arthrobacter TaxID=235627 RepID=UPI001F2315CB|nr:GAF and ANTAR domain-containing protein [Arthrobacter sp. FW305-BF8]UKA56197.1 GAF and ANTAR domain-containing protein [Arthrobacter sp. FW305-BF8]